jgi:hypothetical protein
LRRMVVPKQQGINIKVFVPIKSEKPCAMRQSVTIKPANQEVLL